MFKILDNIFADKGFYINLNSSTDRREHINSLMDKFELTDLNRFEALTDEMIQFSCTKSHLAIYEISLQNDYDVIFVSEDDMSIDEVLYSPYESKQITFGEKIKELYEDLKKVDWDVILFGCNPKKHLIPVTNNLAIDYESTGAWAYLIKKRAYKYILENSNYKKDLIAIDDYLPLLNGRGFKTLCTIPLLINHGIGFVSTLQPRGPVNYDAWIKGSYHKYLFDNYKTNFSKKVLEKEITVVIAGHFVEDYLYYLNYLLYSLPDELRKCRFIVHYDETHGVETNREMYKLMVFFKYHMSDLNVALSSGFGGLISTLETVINKVETPYFIFLEHDWVFMEKDKINFFGLLDAFNNHDFINAVWFGKSDNIMRGYEISRDVDGVTTPFEREDRVDEVDLTTTCRFSNNPALFRKTKISYWYDTIIKNQYVGTVHQSQNNVEENVILKFREMIDKNKWSDIRDELGTFLYGNVGEGPYVAHLDGTKRYQGTSKSEPEYNGEEYVRKNPIPKVQL